MLNYFKNDFELIYTLDESNLKKRLETINYKIESLTNVIKNSQEQLHILEKEKEEIEKFLKVN